MKLTKPASFGPSPLTPVFGGYRCAESRRSHGTTRRLRLAQSRFRGRLPSPSGDATS